MTVDEFLHLAYAFARDKWPNNLPDEVHIRMADGTVKRFTMLDSIALDMAAATHRQPLAEQAPAIPEIPSPEIPPPETRDWVPNDNQTAIIEALAFLALRTDDLIRESGICRGKLYQKPTGGMFELRERGLVKLHPRYGYYRPDAPPEELAASEQDSRESTR